MSKMKMITPYDIAKSKAKYAENSKVDKIDKNKIIPYKEFVLLDKSVQATLMGYWRRNFKAGEIRKGLKCDYGKMYSLIGDLGMSKRNLNRGRSQSKSAEEVVNEIINEQMINEQMQMSNNIIEENLKEDVHLEEPILNESILEEDVSDVEEIELESENHSPLPVSIEEEEVVKEVVNHKVNQELKETINEKTIERIVAEHNSNKENCSYVLSLRDTMIGAMISMKMEKFSALFDGDEDLYEIEVSIRKKSH